jgi:ATP-binding cassette subfamily F protein uup
MFTQSANMIVLDEPTNDLDVDTLELLEDLLLDYDGTLLLVSHDRAFLDNVVSSTLVFEGNGVVAEYIGGYEDWLRQRKSKSESKAGIQERVETASGAHSPRTTVKNKKLSYREKTELDALPDRIDQLEQEQEALQREVSEHGFYKQDKATIAATMQHMETIRLQLEQAYHRWELLDSI